MKTNTLATVANPLAGVEGHGSHVETVRSHQAFTDFSHYERFHTTAVSPEEAAPGPHFADALQQLLSRLNSLNDLHRKGRVKKSDVSSAAHRCVQDAIKLFASCH